MSSSTSQTRRRSDERASFLPQSTAGINSHPTTFVLRQNHGESVCKLLGIQRYLNSVGGGYGYPTLTG
eukprot:scaffold260_cov213-Alexandrium_tamarense.AAC.3